MASATSYSTVNKMGVDVTAQYSVSASSTPETPAPPFSIGDVVHGEDGAEYVFVVATASISLGDFVSIRNSGTAAAMTTTTVQSSLGSRIGMACVTVRASVTYIPAGAYFWAQVRGNSCTSTSGQVSPAATLGAAIVPLYTSATGGVITSTSGSFAGLAGIVVLTSTATGVNAVYQLTWPRTITVQGTEGTLLSLRGLV